MHLENCHSQSALAAHLSLSLSLSLCTCFLAHDRVGSSTPHVEVVTTEELLDTGPRGHCPALGKTCDVNGCVSYRSPNNTSPGTE